MKLNARKSIAAVGTAMALAMAPVAVPTMAPMAVAATSESSYTNRYGQVKNQLTTVKTTMDAREKALQQARKSLAKFDSAQLKLSEAETELTIARGLYTNAKGTFEAAESEYADASDRDSQYGNLGSAQDALNKATTALSRVNTNITEARAAAEKADFKCPGATNVTDDNKVEDGSASGSSIDGLKSMFTSSGNRVVFKDGKKKCVSNREYYTDMLTKLVAVLGTVLTLITTATKISDVVMKSNPAVAGN